MFINAWWELTKVYSAKILLIILSKYTLEGIIYFKKRFHNCNRLFAKYKIAREYEMSILLELGLFCSAHPS